MSNPGRTPANGAGSTSDDDMNVARPAAREAGGDSPTDDDMSVAREPRSDAPQPPGLAGSPAGPGLDVDRGALPVGGAAETTTAGREGASAFNDYPGAEGALGAMPGSDMAQEPGGTDYTGDFEPVQLPDE